MKSLKYGACLALALLLTACDHGFEGVYETRADSSNEMMSQLMNDFAGLVGSEHIVIGTDYIEHNGERTRFDDIFVRESAGKRYLVFVQGEQEEVWTIVDDHTLMKGNGLVKVLMERVGDE
ncbi:hypothetical protein PU634_07015 [Oceanimonas pelagia]|uniref:Lipoprotein n=1 Tax=Oceanimonas pelagia TaxID=3028314 RepID=A0AA50KRV9_9GAMM|nr:hypothetical protein [Oceanimonas pelagia]WMC12108.1 hypothetical protein PU634_07015 [Oceanimonas pelagia]